MKESDIEKEYVKIAQEHYGVLSEKYEVRGRKGRADRINFLPGNHVFFIEFKLDYNTESGHQQKSRQMFERLGYRTYICYSTKHAIQALETELNVFRETH